MPMRSSIDRLLASPRYGERQARMWLDLARYADSTASRTTITRPNMFRYRDYVIKAFNEDKPYSQFIREQIAGDEIAPGNQELLVATGFLAGYPDNSNSRDLVQRKYQITTDMTDTVGQAILGTTVGCARCHNHKTDKFTQKDYYLAAGLLRQHRLRRESARRKGRGGGRPTRRTSAIYDEATKAIRARQKEIIDSVREDGAQISQGALSHRQPRIDLQAEGAVERARPLGQSPARRRDRRRRSSPSILRYTADDKSAPEHSAEIVKKAEEYQKLTHELRKFQNLRSEQRLAHLHRGDRARP